MTNKIVCSLFLCVLQTFAMDDSSKESIFRNTYGYDAGVINNFQLQSLTFASKKKGTPVTILRDNYTNVVHITRRDKGGLVGFCRPCILEDIQKKFEEVGGQESMLNVSLWDGNTTWLLEMGIENIRNQNKVDEFILGKSYYIRDCKLHDSKKKDKDNLLQGQIEYCGHNIDGESREFNHLFSINIEGNSEGALWGALLSPVRKKKIMNYLKKQKPFILELVSLNKGDVINLLVNSFEEPAVEHTSSESFFFRYPAIVIVPVCGLIAYLIYLYSKKS